MIVIPNKICSSAEDTIMSFFKNRFIFGGIENKSHVIIFPWI